MPEEKKRKYTLPGEPPQPWEVKAKRDIIPWDELRDEFGDLFPDNRFWEVAKNQMPEGYKPAFGLGNERYLEQAYKVYQAQLPPERDTAWMQQEGYGAPPGMQEGTQPRWALPEQPMVKPQTALPDETAYGLRKEDRRDAYYSLVDDAIRREIAAGLITRDEGIGKMQGIDQMMDTQADIQTLPYYEQVVDRLPDYGPKTASYLVQLEGLKRQEGYKAGEQRIAQQEAAGLEKAIGGLPEGKVTGYPTFKAKLAAKYAREDIGMQRSQALKRLMDYYATQERGGMPDTLGRFADPSSRAKAALSGTLAPSGAQWLRTRREKPDIQRFQRDFPWISRYTKPAQTGRGLAPTTRWLNF